MEVGHGGGKVSAGTMPEKPLLFTFRSAKEGGEQAISTEAYIALNRAAIDSGLVEYDRSGVIYRR